MDQQATRAKPRSYTEDSKRQVVGSGGEQRAYVDGSGGRGRPAPDIAVPMGAAVWRRHCRG